LTEKQDEMYSFVLEKRVSNSAFVGGLGSGKTVVGTATALTLLQQFPGIRILLCAPTYDQIRQGSLQTFLEWCPPNYIISHNRTDHLITFVFGDGRFNSEMLYRSTTEIDRIRSHEYGAVWWDESAMSSEDARQVIRGRLRSKRGVPEGWHYPIFETTTPRGRNHLWRMYSRDHIPNESPVVRESRLKRFRMVHATTYDNERNLPAGYIEMQELTLSGNDSLRQQELEGLFVNLEGLVWPQFSVMQHVREAPAPWGDGTISRRVAGVDFGGGDPTGIVTLGSTDGERYHVYEERLWTEPVGLDKIGEWLMERHKIAPFNAIWCDPSSQVAIQTLRSAGLPAGPLQGHVSARAINDRAEGIRLVGSYFARNQLTIDMGIGSLVSQIMSYVYREAATQDGTRFVTSTPLDHHADLPDALRYAVMGLTVATRAPVRSRLRARRRPRYAA